MIAERLLRLMSFKPNKIYEGYGSFSNSLAYQFKDSRVTVFESASIDNATYVFGKNWRQCLELSKAEIIRKRLLVARVIHRNDWESHIRKLLNP